jgi:hypothetical protein
MRLEIVVIPDQGDAQLTLSINQLASTDPLASQSIRIVA